MNALFEILEFSMSSLIWGVLIAAICMGLFFFVIKGWWRNAMFTLATYLVGIILFLLLSVQCILICGAIKIIDFTDVIEAKTEQILNTRYVKNMSVTIAESEEIVQDLIAEYPILANYIGYGYFQGYTVETLPAGVGQAVRDFMRSFIIRRLLWCLGFVVVGSFLAVKSISVVNNSGGSGRMRGDSHRRIGNERDYSRTSINRNRPRVRRTR